MLHELDIENYAVVEKLRVSFRRGLNLLTGETGSGKSILVDALTLLFGGRGGADLIRGGAKKTRISGVFEVASDETLAAALEAAGLEADEPEVILERQILAGGKSRGYVNGRPVPIALLKELAPLLGDIHGQHEQQNLFSPKTQLEMLDAFAGSHKELRRTAAIYRDWRDCARKLDELRSNEQERLRMLDLYRFQADEIESAKLQPDEETELSLQRRKLQNLTRLQEAAAAAYDALYDSSVSAAAQLKAALRSIEELAQFESAFERIAESLEGARASAEDAAFELQSYLNGLEADPGRLDEIEDRLAQIEKLKRKYGKTLADVIEYGRETAAKVAELADSETTAEEVEKRRAALGKDYLEAARRLSGRRRQAAERVERLIGAELADLAMERARFRIDFAGGEDESHWSAEGFDRIRFDFSANRGQPLRPLTNVASGGELSRITLALKTCLLPERATSPDVPRTLVFDEIDTGVGGRVAEAIGRRLKRLAINNQVLCVTHLPQIAGFADAHYRVEKTDRNEQTFASVAELAEKERVAELARMLSGARVTQAALENAEQLLKTAAAVQRS